MHKHAQTIQGTTAHIYILYGAAGATKQQEFVQNQRITQFYGTFKLQSCHLLRHGIEKPSVGISILSLSPKKNRRNCFIHHLHVFSLVFPTLSIQTGQFPPFYFLLMSFLPFHTLIWAYSSMFHVVFFHFVVLLVLNAGNGSVAGGCWDDY